MRCCRSGPFAVSWIIFATARAGWWKSPVPENRLSTGLMLGAQGHDIRATSSRRAGDFATGRHSFAGDDALASDPGAVRRRIRTCGVRATAQTSAALGEIISPGAAFLGLVLLPYLEELLRGIHGRGRTD